MDQPAIKRKGRSPLPARAEGESLRPPIFDERNRELWEMVRKLLIYVLRQLDKWYGWRTFGS